MPPAPETELTASPGSVWSRARQDVAAVLWPSFLAATLATAVFFAMFDPLALYDDAAFLREAFSGRLTGYGLGLFCFWAVTALSSTVTLFLVRTARPEPPATPTGTSRREVS